MFSYLSEKLNVKALGEMIAPTLTPEQQLHQAIEDNLIDKVRHLLDDVKVSPNARTPEGSFPVHTAAYNGRVDILLALIERGADISALGPRDNTPLHLACAQGHLEMAKLLVAKGANVAQRNKSHKTSYDVATGDTLRQWLLPLQFQHEDPTDRAAAIQQAQNMGLSGFETGNVVAAPPPPPPTSGAYYGAPPSGAAPPAPYDPHAALYAPPTHSAIPRHNPSAQQTRRDPSVFRPIQADGFGSSVGNPELTAKFGNTVSVTQTSAPPPPPGGAGPSAYAPFAASEPTSTPVPMRQIQPPPQFKIFNPRAASGGGRPHSAGVSQPPPAVASSGPFSGPSAYSAAPGFHHGPPSPTESPTHHGDAIDFSATTSALQ
ncbi:hypothetical protein H310_11279 [Aphanomyces invadans]|uniref:Uncharacterized protein n=1 Tax=Aphanomyces invadans TaxID=157072 RepID=A0A024TQ19_9STRA|nr:hypothetical protein H310_11279 [Aphanomyces invadans]ETV95402.1 hypothetical protein H310_11279 [Aphanomyces invadans]|eukprot:XP_008876103.1 hypothetical protein H310_11279 [Aphanomyces invadans]